MKKHFPSNILEVIVLLFSPFLFVFFVFALNAFVLKFPNEILTKLTYTTYCSFFFVIYIIINRINKVKIKFNFRLKKSFFILSISVLVYLFGLAMPITFLINSNKMPSTINIFSLIILSPIFEEVLFRGIILKGLLLKYNHRKAILLSTSLFAIMHININNLIGASLNFVWAFILGYFISLVFYKTKSLGMAIVLHATNNTIGIFGIYLNNKYGNIKINSFSDIYGLYSIYIISISIVILVIIIYWYYNKYSFHKNPAF